MANMMRCPACKKNISVETESCPKCGHPITDADREKDRKAKKNAGIGCLVIFAFLALMYVIGQPSSSSTPQETTRQSRPEPQKDYSQYAGQVERFFNQVLGHARAADNAATKFQGYSQKMAKGQGDLFTAYALAKDAKNKAESANHAISKTSLPDLPSELKSLLQKGRSELSTCYYVKANAFEAGMKFLDTQRPSALEEFKERSEEAQTFMVRGIAKLTSAKMKAGLIE
ncbi:zinc ribbon domain-containing protein [Desulfovibrio oxyclinae]|uniref:zinc ribbon domain-containing protein n=1 Tax=Desulfovibrio oxyclinae TaxID=63560 RepID=UPI000363DE3E|nr:zinc ribbon domain-containing protein [Desulfovibrio oxyclinae]